MAIKKWSRHNVMKPFKYIDVVRTKKGKLRTWKGYIRALQKMEGFDNKKRRELEKGVGWMIT